MAKDGVDENRLTKIIATPEMISQEQAELDRLFMEAYQHYPTYAKRYLKIQTMDGKKINYHFNEIQNILEEIVNDIENNTGFIRAFILKARREGVSTYFTGRFFWKTANQKNRYSCLVTHEPEASDFLFKMQKRYHDNLPPEFKPQTKYNNTKMLEFNNKAGDGLDSAIRVGTAGKSDFGSAQLIHHLHLSEVSKWPAENQSALLISLLQCVPKEEDTAVVYESTAKGIGGEFYNGF